MEDQPPFIFTRSFHLMFTDYNSYSLSVKEGWERQAELKASNDAHLCWKVITKDSDDICFTKEETDELRVQLETENTIYSIEELPF